MITRFHFKICEKTIKTQIYFTPQPDEMNKIKQTLEQFPHVCNYTLVYKYINFKCDNLILHFAFILILIFYFYSVRCGHKKNDESSQGALNIERETRQEAAP